MFEPVFSQIREFRGQFTSKVNPLVSTLKKRFEKGQAEVVERVDSLREKADQFREQAEDIGKSALSAATQAKEQILTQVDELKNSNPEEIRKQTKTWFRSLNRQATRLSGTIKERLAEFIKTRDWSDLLGRSHVKSAGEKTHKANSKPKVKKKERAH